MSFRSLLVHVAILIALVANFSPKHAIAQASGDSTASQKEAVQQASRSDPTLTSPLQDQKPALVLLATEDGGKISGQAAWRINTKWDLGLQLEAPFDKNNPETNLADLDGLAGDTVGTLRLTRELYSPIQSASGSLSAVCDDYNNRLIGKAQKSRPNWQPIPDGQCKAGAFTNRGGEWQQREAQAARMAIQNLCEDYNKANPQAKLLDRLKPEKDPDKLLPPGYKGYCSASQFSPAMIAKATEKALGNVCESYNKPPEPELIEEADCRYLTLTKKAKELGGKAGRDLALRSLRAIPYKMTHFGISYSVSEPSFSFVDPETLEAGKASETNRSIGLSWLRYAQGFRFGIGYKFRETYKAGQKVELCNPVEGTSSLTCTDVRLGGPKKSEQDIVSFDTRWQFHPSVAFNVRLLYDLEEDYFNPHLLVFFLPAKDGVLNGGLDLSFDEDSDFNARLFVGTKFDIFGN